MNLKKKLKTNIKSYGTETPPLRIITLSMHTKSFITFGAMILALSLFLTVPEYILAGYGSTGQAAQTHDLDIHFLHHRDKYQLDQSPQQSPPELPSAIPEDYPQVPNDDSINQEEPQSGVPISNEDQIFVPPFTIPEEPQSGVPPVSGAPPDPDPNVPEDYPPSPDDAAAPILPVPEPEEDVEGPPAAPILPEDPCDRAPSTVCLVLPHLPSPDDAAAPILPVPEPEEDVESPPAAPILPVPEPEEDVEGPPAAPILPVPDNPGDEEDPSNGGGDGDEEENESPDNDDEVPPGLNH